MTTAQFAPTTVMLPALGENADEGTVTRWLKQPGDRIAAEDPLLEIATDKVDTEIPSPVAGILDRVLAEEGAVVPIGAALAVIASLVNCVGGDREPVQPVGVLQSPEPSMATSAAPAALGQSGVKLAHKTPDAPTSSTTEKLTRVRRTIARRMVESLCVSAQLTTVIEVDVTTIDRLRRAHKNEFLQRTGVKLSFLPFFTKAAVDALAEHRTLNSSLNADATVSFRRRLHLSEDDCTLGESTIIESFSI